MKRKIHIAVVAILVLYSCKKEAVESQISSSQSSQLTAVIYNTWSGWAPWKGEKVNFWYTDKVLANKMAEIMTKEYLDTDSTKSFVKGVPTRTISLEDPCDPIVPPGDIAIKSKGKTYIIHKNGTTTVLDCGSGNGGTSFTITFTFSGNGYNVPDYTVTITVYEENGVYESGTITMQPSSRGAYGTYTQETTPEEGVTFKPYSPAGTGGVLMFNVNANTQSTMGFSAPNTSTTQTQHANYLMNMNGYIPLDGHFNQSGVGRAWLKPRRTK